MDVPRNLPQSTVDALQELIRINLDSCKNLAQVYTATSDEKLIALFREIGEQRKEFATQLGVHVFLNEGDLSPKGTLLEEIYRWWLHLTGALERGDARVVLEVAERGESALEQAYARVIADSGGRPVTEVLVAQHGAIRQGLARIQGLLRELS